MSAEFLLFTHELKFLKPVLKGYVDLTIKYILRLLQMGCSMLFVKLIYRENMNHIRVKNCVYKPLSSLFNCYYDVKSSILFARKL